MRNHFILCCNVNAKYVCDPVTDELCVLIPFSKYTLDAVIVGQSVLLETCYSLIYLGHSERRPVCLALDLLFTGDWSVNMQILSESWKTLLDATDC